MILKWFDTKEVDALADRLTRDLIKRVSTIRPDQSEKKLQAKEQRVHEMALRQAQEFAARHKLNVYTKARLANRIKWTLLEAGYPKELVDELAYDVAAVMAAARVPSK